MLLSILKGLVLVLSILIAKHLPWWLTLGVSLGLLSVLLVLSVLLALSVLLESVGDCSFLSAVGWSSWSGLVFFGEASSFLLRLNKSIFPMLGNSPLHPDIITAEMVIDINHDSLIVESFLCCISLSINMMLILYRRFVSCQRKKAMVMRVVLQVSESETYEKAEVGQGICAFAKKT